MTTDTNTQLKALLKSISPLLKQLGEISLTDINKSQFETLFGKDNVKDGIYTCKVCGKSTPLSNLKIINDPIGGAIFAYTCPDCWNLIKTNHLCKIVCIGCKELKQAVEPFVNPKNGMKFVKDGIYHMLNCPVCAPDQFHVKGMKQGQVVAVPLIEEVIYDNKLKERIIKKESLI